MTVPPRDKTNDPINDRSADDRMTELRQLFFETAAELVQKLNDEAMQLEKSPGDPETSRSLRRTVHTLKGDAAACGFRELSEMCHQLEHGHQGAPDDDRVPGWAPRHHRHGPW